MMSRKVFGAIVSALVLMGISAWAFGQDDYSEMPQAFSQDDDAPPSDAGMAFASSDCGGCGDVGCYQRSCWSPRWTASADFIILDRSGTNSQTLIQRYYPDGDGSADHELLNSNDFHQGFYGGPRVGLIRHGDCCYDVELLYFQIDGWSSSRSVTPDRQSQDEIGFTTPEYIVDSYADPMQFNYSSKLYNGELNLRWNPTCRVTMLAGFRWVELREKLEGGLVPSTFESFWNTDARNNLYGLQLGADTILWQGCRLSIDGVVKAGIFGNHAEQRSSLQYSEYSGSVFASTNHAAFLGELGLQAKYQVTKCFSLRAGYEVIWIDGVALAPGQIPVTWFEDTLTGVNTKGTVFYHGATAGFEYSF